MNSSSNLADPKRSTVRPVFGLQISSADCTHSRLDLRSTALGPSHFVHGESSATFEPVTIRRSRIFGFKKSELGSHDRASVTGGRRADRRSERRPSPSETSVSEAGAPDSPRPRKIVLRKILLVAPGQPG